MFVRSSSGAVRRHAAAAVRAAPTPSALLASVPSGVTAMSAPVSAPGAPISTAQLPRGHFPSPPTTLPMHPHPSIAVPAAAPRVSTSPIAPHRSYSSLPVSTTLPGSCPEAMRSTIRSLHPEAIELSPSLSLTHLPSGHVPVARSMSDPLIGTVLALLAADNPLGAIMAIERSCFPALLSSLQSAEAVPETAAAAAAAAAARAGALAQGVSTEDGAYIPLHEDSGALAYNGQQQLLGRAASSSPALGSLTFAALTRLSTHIGTDPLTGAITSATVPDAAWSGRGSLFAGTGAMPLLPALPLSAATIAAAYWRAGFEAAAVQVLQNHYSLAYALGNEDIAPVTASKSVAARLPWGLHSSALQQLLALRVPSLASTLLELLHRQDVVLPPVAYVPLLVQARGDAVALTELVRAMCDDLTLSYDHRSAVGPTDSSFLESEGRRAVDPFAAPANVFLPAELAEAGPGAHYHGLTSPEFESRLLSPSFATLTQTAAGPAPAAEAGAAAWPPAELLTPAAQHRTLHALQRHAAASGYSAVAAAAAFMGTRPGDGSAQTGGPHSAGTGSVGVGCAGAGLGVVGVGAPGLGSGVSVESLAWAVRYGFGPHTNPAPLSHGPSVSTPAPYPGAPPASSPALTLLRAPPSAARAGEAAAAAAGLTAPLVAWLVSRLTALGRGKDAVELHSFAVAAGANLLTGKGTLPFGAKWEPAGGLLSAAPGCEHDEDEDEDYAPSASVVSPPVLGSCRVMYPPMRLLPTPHDSDASPSGASSSNGNGWSTIEGVCLTPSGWAALRKAGSWSLPSFASPSDVSRAVSLGLGGGSDLGDEQGDELSFLGDELSAPPHTPPLSGADAESSTGINASRAAIDEAFAAYARSRGLVCAETVPLCSLFADEAGVPPETETDPAEPSPAERSSVMSHAVSALFPSIQARGLHMGLPHLPPLLVSRSTGYTLTPSQAALLPSGDVIALPPLSPSVAATVATRAAPGLGVAASGLVVVGAAAPALRASFLPPPPPPQPLPVYLLRYRPARSLGAVVAAAAAAGDVVDAAALLGVTAGMRRKAREEFAAFAAVVGDGERAGAVEGAPLSRVGAVAFLDMLSRIAGHFSSALGLAHHSLRLSDGLSVSSGGTVKGAGSGVGVGLRLQLLSLAAQSAFSPRASFALDTSDSGSAAAVGNTTFHRARDPYLALGLYATLLCLPGPAAAPPAAAAAVVARMLLQERMRGPAIAAVEAAVLVHLALVRRAAANTAASSATVATPSSAASASEPVPFPLPSRDHTSGDVAVGSAFGGLGMSPASAAANAAANAAAAAAAAAEQADKEDLEALASAHGEYLGDSALDGHRVLALARARLALASDADAEAASPSTGLTGAQFEEFLVGACPRIGLLLPSLSLSDVASLPTRPPAHLLLQLHRALLLPVHTAPSPAPLGSTTPSSTPASSSGSPNLAMSLCPSSTSHAVRLLFLVLAQRSLPHPRVLAAAIRALRGAPDPEQSGLAALVKVFTHAADAAAAAAAASMGSVDHTAFGSTDASTGNGAADGIDDENDDGFGMWEPSLLAPLEILTELPLRLLPTSLLAPPLLIGPALVAEAEPAGSVSAGMVLEAAMRREIGGFIADAAAALITPSRARAADEAPATATAAATAAATARRSAYLVRARGLAGSLHSPAVVSTARDELPSLPPASFLPPSSHSPPSSTAAVAAAAVSSWPGLGGAASLSSGAGAGAGDVGALAAAAASAAVAAQRASLASAARWRLFTACLAVAGPTDTRGDAAMVLSSQEVVDVEGHVVKDQDCGASEWARVLHPASPLALLAPRALAAAATAEVSVQPSTSLASAAITSPLSPPPRLLSALIRERELVQLSSLEALAIAHARDANWPAAEGMWCRLVRFAEAVTAEAEAAATGAAEAAAAAATAAGESPEAVAAAAAAASASVLGSPSLGAASGTAETLIRVRSSLRSVASAVVCARARAFRVCAAVERGVRKRRGLPWVLPRSQDQWREQQQSEQQQQGGKDRSRRLPSAIDASPATAFAPRYLERVGGLTSEQRVAAMRAHAAAARLFFFAGSTTESIGEGTEEVVSESLTESVASARSTLLPGFSAITGCEVSARLADEKGLEFLFTLPSEAVDAEGFRRLWADLVLAPAHSQSPPARLSRLLLSMSLSSLAPTASPLSALALLATAATTRLPLTPSACAAALAVFTRARAVLPAVAVLALLPVAVKSAAARRAALAQAASPPVGTGTGADGAESGLMTAGDKAIVAARPLVLDSLIYCLAATDNATDAFMLLLPSEARRSWLPALLSLDAKAPPLSRRPCPVPGLVMDGATSREDALSPSASDSAGSIPASAWLYSRLTRSIAADSFLPAHCLPPRHWRTSEPALLSFLDGLAASPHTHPAKKEALRGLAALLVADAVAAVSGSESSQASSVAVTAAETLRAGLSGLVMDNRWSRLPQAPSSTAHAHSRSEVKPLQPAFATPARALALPLTQSLLAALGAGAGTGDLAGLAAVAEAGAAAASAAASERASRSNGRSSRKAARDASPTAAQAAHGDHGHASSLPAAAATRALWLRALASSADAQILRLGPSAGPAAARLQLLQPILAALRMQVRSGNIAPLALVHSIVGAVDTRPPYVRAGFAAHMQVLTPKMLLDPAHPRTVPALSPASAAAAAGRTGLDDPAASAKAVDGTVESVVAAAELAKAEYLPLALSFTSNGDAPSKAGETDPLSVLAATAPELVRAQHAHQLSLAYTLLGVAAGRPALLAPLAAAGADADAGAGADANAACAAGSWAGPSAGGRFSGSTYTCKGGSGERDMVVVLRYLSSGLAKLIAKNDAAAANAAVAAAAAANAAKSDVAASEEPPQHELEEELEHEEDEEESGWDADEIPSLPNLGRKLSRSRSHTVRTAFSSAKGTRGSDRGQSDRGSPAGVSSTRAGEAHGLGSRGVDIGAREAAAMGHVLSATDAIAADLAAAVAASALTTAADAGACATAASASQLPVAIPASAVGLLSAPLRLQAALGGGMETAPASSAVPASGAVSVNSSVRASASITASLALLARLSPWITSFAPSTAPLAAATPESPSLPFPPAAALAALPAASLTSATAVGTRAPMAALGPAQRLVEELGSFAAHAAATVPSTFAGAGECELDTEAHDHAVAAAAASLQTDIGIAITTASAVAAAARLCRTALASTAPGAVSSLSGPSRDRVRARARETALALLGTDSKADDGDNGRAVGIRAGLAARAARAAAAARFLARHSAARVPLHEGSVETAEAAMLAPFADVGRVMDEELEALGKMM